MPHASADYDTERLRRRSSTLATYRYAYLGGSPPSVAYDGVTNMWRGCAAFLLLALHGFVRAAAALLRRCKHARLAAIPRTSPLRLLALRTPSTLPLLT